MPRTASASERTEDKKDASGSSDGWEGGGTAAASFPHGGGEHGPEIDAEVGEGGGRTVRPVPPKRSEMCDRRGRVRAPGNGHGDDDMTPRRSKDAGRSTSYRTDAGSPSRARTSGVAGLQGTGVSGEGGEGGLRLWILPLSRGNVLPCGQC